MQSRYFVATQKPQDQTIHFDLATYVPEIVPPVEEQEIIEKEEPVIEKEVIKEPEPEPEPIIKKEPLPEKVIPEPIEPKVIPLPVVKKIEKKPVVKKKIVKKRKKRVKKRVSTQTTKGRKRTGTARKNNIAKKSQFLAKIRQKINQHKSYPKIARRRGMQGKVKVKFTILANGNVGHISVSGPKVFHNSARQAVKRAFPVSTKNIPLSLPQSVNLTLRYQLR
jgi:protein TonB